MTLVDVATRVMVRNLGTHKHVQTSNAFAHSPHMLTPHASTHRTHAHKYIALQPPTPPPQPSERWKMVSECSLRKCASLRSGNSRSCHRQTLPYSRGHGALRCVISSAHSLQSYVVGSLLPPFLAVLSPRVPLGRRLSQSTVGERRSRTQPERRRCRVVVRARRSPRLGSSGQGAAC